MAESSSYADTSANGMPRESRERSLEREVRSGELWKLRPTVWASTATVGPALVVFRLPLFPCLFQENIHPLPASHPPRGERSALVAGVASFRQRWTFGYSFRVV
ncbi:Uncharacterized protein Rs2_17890 [Raphanus sativus]|nr:Uncharacterized protein Rs2_17890 [Raphanus sativus]